MKNVVFIILLFGLLAMHSCKQMVGKVKVKEVASFNYQPTLFTKDTTKLWMSEGLIESDTVLIMGDGGPKNLLDYEWNGKLG